MSLLTLAAARTALFKYASNVPLASATLDEKAAFDAVLNQACERFILSGKWRGSIARARFVVYDNQITLPRALETVISGMPVLVNTEDENSGVCGWSYSIFNQWYEISTDAVGNVNACCVPGLVDLGEHWPTFRTPSTNFYVRAVSEQTETSKTMLLRGVDEDGDEIYTAPSTQGTTISLSRHTLTTQKFSRLDSWVKSAATNGIVRLYYYPMTGTPASPVTSIVTEITTVNGAPFTPTVITGTATASLATTGSGEQEWYIQVLGEGALGASVDLFERVNGVDTLVVGGSFSVANAADPLILNGSNSVILPAAAYNLDERTLVYVRREFPGTLFATIYPSELTSGYRRYAVEATDGDIVSAVCKRAYVPAVSDNDFVIPSNLGALKAGLQALQFEDKVDENRAREAWDRAFAILDRDRQEYDGDSAISPLNMACDYGCGSIPNLI